MTQRLLAPSDLTAMDRCDRCGAQAFYRAVLTSGELLFCAHHGREYGDKLAVAAVRVDRSGDLDDRSGDLDDTTGPAGS